MLQNNGPFGPNDMPVNSQANMTEMSGQMSAGNSVNNISKITQPPPHPMNAPFHLPDYVNYGLNMNSTLNPFHNFHQISYQQNLMSQSAIQDSWQQSPLPMNLNTQNELSAHSYFDKKLESQSEYSHPYSRNMLNIPQVYPKPYKHLGMESYPHYNHGINSFNQYFDHNIDLRAKAQKQTQLRHHQEVTTAVQRFHKLGENLEVDLRSKIPRTDVPRAYEPSASAHPLNQGNLDLSFKQHDLLPLKSDKVMESAHCSKTFNTPLEKTIPPINHNLDLSTKFYKPEPNSIEDTEKLPIDQVRRRNLANTVKMIEDILNQTTIARQKELEDQEVKTTVYNSDKEQLQLQQVTATTSDKTVEECKMEDNSKLSDKSFGDSNSKIEQIFQSDDDASNISACESVASPKKEAPATETSHEDQLLTVKQELHTDSESSEESEDEFKDKDIVEKMEVAPDLDIEFNPFHKDSFGVHRDNIIDCTIHNAEQSVSYAKEAIKNGNVNSMEYFECKHCNLYFNHPKRYLVHIKWHSFGLTNEKRAVMQTAKEMRRRLLREARVLERIKKDEVVNAESAKGKTYNCKDCDKVFCKKSSLKNHQQRYHPNKHRECKICGKVLIGWVALRDHHLTHVGESGFQCADCPKRFKYSHSLAKHRDTHLEKTHACPQCPKMFGSAALLNVHSKTHERMLRGATFRCTYCGKGFFESYHLQAHERTHRNERPFVCEICKTSFGTNSGLKRHLKVSHSTSKPFECSICHRSFMSEAIRDRHELRNHGNPEDFKFLCKQCPSRYLKLKDLKKHVYKVHPKGKRKKKVQSDSE